MFPGVRDSETRRWHVKRMHLTDSSAPALVEEDVPQLQPGPGELLIRVHAAGVTPTELLWYPTTHTKGGGKRTNAVPSHEFSGVIAALGAGVQNVEAGQEVYGMNDWFADGATAEYCLTEPSFVAPKPRSLTHVQAASVPIGALTAWQGLFDRAQLQPGERVLVHGAAGAVGIYVVQLARYRGARVTATASARNLEFVKQLGAEQMIDYHAQRFDEVAHDMDVVFDAVGGETLERSWGVLAGGGRMVTIAAAAEASTDDRVKQAFFIVEPNREQLIEIGKLLDGGQLRPVVDAVLPFADAPATYAGRAPQKRGRGKLVISVIDEARSSARM